MSAETETGHFRIATTKLSADQVNNASAQSNDRLTQMITALNTTLDRDIAKHLRRGTLAVMAFGAVTLLFGAGVPISGAVVSTGSVAVESNLKPVAHEQGGRVMDVLVTDGQIVRAGDLLVRLDATQSRAGLDIVESRRDALLAERQRLEAERDGQSKVVLDQDKFEARFESVQHADALTRHQKLFDTRAAQKAARKAQIQEQIAQVQEQITGLESRLGSVETERRLVAAELERLRPLRTRKVISETQFNDVVRQLSRLDGEQGQLSAEIAASRVSMSEKRLELLEVDENFQANVLDRLNAVETELAELEERRKAALDTVDQAGLRAPVSGVVSGLAVHARGAVVTPGQTVLTIVPDDDTLIVEAPVRPSDIDLIHVGQESRVRLTAFDMRSIPDFPGEVTFVSASTEMMPNGVAAYRARIRMNGASLPEGAQLVPGMPADVFIMTGERTVLGYLTKPLMDHITRAFREQ